MAVLGEGGGGGSVGCSVGDDEWRKDGSSDCYAKLPQEFYCLACCHWVL